VSVATGAQVDVELIVDKEPDAMWGLITDVARIGEWSPECKGGAWLEGGTPRSGARFEGENHFNSGFIGTTICVVTEAQSPSVFEYVVLDPSHSPDSPGSIWRYELAPGEAPGQTLVHQRFVHGPGITGLSQAMASHPEQAQEILQGRLDQLRSNMTVTVEGMGRS
jgi:polyketide cyclase/dehydrase/lipid transport protein